MSKTDERRLQKIEAALSPKEAFLLWLAEAQQYDSFASYVMSLKGQAREQHPMRTLPKQVEQTVRERHQGEKPPEPARRETRALIQAGRDQRIEDEVIQAVREV